MKWARGKCIPEKELFFRQPNPRLFLALMQQRGREWAGEGDFWVGCGWAGRQAWEGVGRSRPVVVKTSAVGGTEVGGAECGLTESQEGGGIGGGSPVSYFLRLWHEKNLKTTAQGPQLRTTAPFPLACTVKMASLLRPLKGEPHLAT